MKKFRNVLLKIAFGILSSFMIFSLSTNNFTRDNLVIADSENEYVDLASIAPHNIKTAMQSASGYTTNSQDIWTDLITATLPSNDTSYALTFNMKANINLPGDVTRIIRIQLGSSDIRIHSYGDGTNIVAEFFDARDYNNSGWFSHTNIKFDGNIHNYKLLKNKSGENYSISLFFDNELIACYNSTFSFDYGATTSNFAFAQASGFDITFYTTLEEKEPEEELIYKDLALYDNAKDVAFGKQVEAGEGAWDHKYIVYDSTNTSNVVSVSFDFMCDLSLESSHALSFDIGGTIIRAHRFIWDEGSSIQFIIFDSNEGVTKEVQSNPVTLWTYDSTIKHNVKIYKEKVNNGYKLVMSMDDNDIFDEVIPYAFEFGKNTYCFKIANNSLNDLTIYSHDYFGVKETVGNESNIFLYEKEAKHKLSKILGIWSDGNKIYNPNEEIEINDNVEYKAYAVSVVDGAKASASFNLEDGSYTASLNYKTSIDKESFNSLLNSLKDVDVNATAKIGYNLYVAGNAEAIYTNYYELNDNQTYKVTYEVENENSDKLYSYISFVEIKVLDKTYIIENEVSDNARSISSIATLAYNDRKDSSDDTYKYLTKEGNYSKYNEEMLNVLKTYMV